MASAILFQNQSDDRKLDKVLTEIRTISVEYKDDTDIISPVVKIQYFDGATNANYIYLSDFGRYYFIRTISVAQQFVYMSLEIDVLMTYRQQIRKQTCIVKRQAQRAYADLYLDDEKFVAREYSRIRTKSFSNGFTTNAFVLAVLGGS